MAEQVARCIAGMNGQAFEQNNGLVMPSSAASSGYATPQVGLANAPRD